MAYHFHTLISRSHSFCFLCLCQLVAFGATWLMGKARDGECIRLKRRRLKAKAQNPRPLHCSLTTPDSAKLSITEKARKLSFPDFRTPSGILRHRHKPPCPTFLGCPVTAFLLLLCMLAVGHCPPQSTLWSTQVNDSRKFVLLSQLVKRRSIDEVKELMAPPETLEAALQRVRQQVGLGHIQTCSVKMAALEVLKPRSGQVGQ